MSVSPERLSHFGDSLAISVLHPHKGVITSKLQDDMKVTINRTAKALTRVMPSNATRLAIVCIGARDIIGYSIGPRVGTMLSKLKLKNCRVYGSLKSHLSYLELKKGMLRIPKNVDCTIAIDAGYSLLGGNVGCISVAAEPIIPASFSEKMLNPIGNVSVIGVVAAVDPDDNEKLLFDVDLDAVALMSQVIASALEKMLRAGGFVCDAKKNQSIA